MHTLSLFLAIIGFTGQPRAVFSNHLLHFEFFRVMKHFLNKKEFIAEVLFAYVLWSKMRRFRIVMHRMKSSPYSPGTLNQSVVTQTVVGELWVNGFRVSTINLNR